jgi:hypothetical protein
LLGKRPPAHATGHDDVGKQQVEVAVAAQEFERLRSGRGGNDGIAEQLELFGDVVADEFFVFDDEDFAGAAGGAG